MTKYRDMAGLKAGVFSQNAKGETYCIALALIQCISYASQDREFRWISGIVGVSSRARGIDIALPILIYPLFPEPELAPEILVLLFYLGVFFTLNLACGL